MPLDALANSPGGLDDFRISAPSEILAYLKKLCNGSVPMNLVGADGPAYTSSIWAVDVERGIVVFTADMGDPDLQQVLKGHQAVAVGYLDNIKLQFDASGLATTRNGRAVSLSVRIPREMFRFQRRDAYRVRPLPRTAPLAHVRHPESRGQPLEFRVLDLSISGCSLLVPPNAPPMQPGATLDGVHIDLDGNSAIRCTLKLHHVSSLGEGMADAPPGSIRIGCEMLGLAPDSRRTLQRFIDTTQQRRRSVMSI